jgi:hypothetical protein
LPHAAKSGLRWPRQASRMLVACLEATCG